MRRADNLRPTLCGAATPSVKVRAPLRVKGISGPANEDMPLDVQGARREYVDFPFLAMGTLLVPVGTQCRPPRAGKYFSLTQRRPLFGCRRLVQRHNAFQISWSTYAKTAPLTTRR